MSENVQTREWTKPERDLLVYFLFQYLTKSINLPKDF